MYKIVTTPDPVLAQIAQPVTSFDHELATTLKNMEKTLLATEDPKGVGLAAPQVGLSLRIFQTKSSEKAPVLNFINPEIVKISKTLPKKTELEKKLLEGCLSIPNIWGNVTRKRSLTLQYQDEKGKSHTKKFTGFMATIIQHEVDHLNGILFTKHVVEQGEKLYRSYKNSKGEDEFEEIKI